MNNGQPQQVMEPNMGEARRREASRAQQQIDAEMQRKEALTSGMTPEQHAERLATVRAALLEKNEFKVGDLITFKDGCGDANIPQPGYPIVVHEILGNPVVEEKASITDTRYGRQYDMIALAVFNNIVAPFHIESIRYKPYTPPEEA